MVSMSLSIMTIAQFFRVKIFHFWEQTLPWLTWNVEQHSMRPWLVFWRLSWLTMKTSWKSSCDQSEVKTVLCGAQVSGLWKCETCMLKLIWRFTYNILLLHGLYFVVTFSGVWDTCAIDGSSRHVSLQRKRVEASCYRCSQGSSGYLFGSTEQDFLCVIFWMVVPQVLDGVRASDRVLVCWAQRG